MTRRGSHFRQLRWTCILNNVIKHRLLEREKRRQWRLTERKKEGKERIRKKGGRIRKKGGRRRREEGDKSPREEDVSWGETHKHTQS